MPLDKATQANASVVMDKAVYERLRAVATRNKRSISKQILLWIEEQLELEEAKTRKK
jgi:hypothetical protein